MKTPKNPFLLTGYHSPNYFCGRDKELKWLLDQMDNERNVVLYARRRIGKSALIRHLFHHLEKQKKARTIYVDLLGTTNLASANQKIGKTIIEQFGDLSKGLKANLLKLIGGIGATVSLDPNTGFPQIGFSSNPRQLPAQSLRSIGDFLKESSEDIVICLDEFQEILDYPDKEAEALFRTWTQEYPMIRFIFSGSHRHMMEAMFSEKSRPFYRSAQLYPLDTLDQQEYKKFILHHFSKAKKELSVERIDEILSWTKVQTYYVQLVCNKLFGSDETNQAQLLEIFNEIIMQEVPIFSTYKQLLTAFQWKVLLALAKGEVVMNPLSKKFIHEHDLGAPSSVSTALAKLVKNELVIKDDGYEVQDVLLMRWLQVL